jgi:hypothetical protein
MATVFPQRARRDDNNGHMAVQNNLDFLKDLLDKGTFGSIGPPGPTGPAGPAGPGIPLPAVNGQWIKGAGGVPVWSAIADADVPSLSAGQRLGTVAAAHSDWNAITTAGWWMAAGAANAPDAQWWIGLVLVHDPSWQVQNVWQFTNWPLVQRVRAKIAGSWTAWVNPQTPDTWHTVGAAGEPGFQNGWSNYGGGWPAMRFTKLSDGTVHLQGLVKDGTVGSGVPIFALPAGYRPTAGIGLRFAVVAANLLGVSNVNSSSGNVDLEVGSNGYVFLNVSFSTL